MSAPRVYAAHFEDADSPERAGAIEEISQLMGRVLPGVPKGADGHWRIAVFPVGNRLRLEMEFHVDSQEGA